MLQPPRPVSGTSRCRTRRSPTCATSTSAASRNHVPVPPRPTRGLPPQRAGPGCLRCEACPSAAPCPAPSQRRRGSGVREFRRPRRRRGRMPPRTRSQASRPRIRRRAVRRRRHRASPPRRVRSRCPRRARRSGRAPRPRSPVAMPPGRSSARADPRRRSRRHTAADPGWRPLMRSQWRRKSQRDATKPARTPRGPIAQRLLNSRDRAVSSVGRALARQARGHWFEPSTAHILRDPFL